MKKEIVGVLVCTLLVATAGIPVLGITNVAKTKTVEKNMLLGNDIEQDGTTNSQVNPPQWHPPWWYWLRDTSITPPTVYTANSGDNVRIDGIIEMKGFKMPTGASSGYVLTSDAAGVGTWQELTRGGDGGEDDDWRWSDGTDCAGDIYHYGDVSIGGTTSGLISGADRYLTLYNRLSFGDNRISSFEISGCHEGSGSQIAKIDFVDYYQEALNAPVSISNVARITALHEAGGAGNLWFQTNDGTTLINRLTIDEEGEVSISGDVRIGGNVGIGTNNPTNILHLHGNSNDFAIGFTNQANTNGQRGFRIAFDNNRLTFQRASDTGAWEANYMTINQDTGNVGIGTINPQELLDVRGTTRTGILEITGGSDIAEPFIIEDSIEVEPGIIVVIDPDSPGNLKISDKPYDRCVAGIVSGAGGINPGLTLTQGDILCGEHQVALAGRVYGLCDASYGAIEPGDLLTTSPVPGYAMKVTDYEQAQGAIIGKAMTSLEKGQGLVLILVSLQ